MATWDDAYTDEPTHVRITSDQSLNTGKVEWFLDGADDEGNYTEQCWSYDSFDEATAAIPEFVQNTTEYSHVKWKWRAHRHDQN